MSVDTTPNSPLLRGLRPELVKEYLELTGWHLVAQAGGRWWTLHGPAALDGHPLEVILPRDSRARDVSVYLASAINLLTALTDEPPETVVRRIKYCDRDVLNMRIVETDEYDSIALELAAKEVVQLKRLVAFGASSEHEPKPHFNEPLSIGRRMVERYRFGHTFAGSFGLTIESPVIGGPFQLPLFHDDSDRVEIMPLERRVMERIVRGLLATQSAVTQQDGQILVHQYSGGFNANMCDAIVQMSRDRTLPLEYTVLWSPKLEPEKGVKDAGTVHLGERAYQYLQDASEELRELQPEYVTVRGMVTDLSSKGAPLGPGEIPRSVAIRWTDRPDGARPVKVIVSLGRDDYIQSLDAHREWKTVSVTGVIQRVGALWRLSDPRDFRVVW